MPAPLTGPLDLSILGHVAMRIGRAGSVSYHAGSDECAPFVSVSVGTDDDDEEICRYLCAHGAVVTRPREHYESRGYEWHRTALEHGGVSYDLTTQRRAVVDLVPRLAETAARVEGGETLAAIREQPLRVVRS